MRLLVPLPPRPFPPAGGQLQELWMQPGCRAQCSLSPEPVDFCFLQRSDSFPGSGQVDQPLFHAQDLLSCRSPVSWGVGPAKPCAGTAAGPPGGALGGDPSPHLGVPRDPMRALSDSLQLLACAGSLWPQLVPGGPGLSRPPPGARPLPSTLPSRGVGTRRAQGNGPRVGPPLPVNYAGGWHRCSSYSSFPSNFRSGIPLPAQRAASPARPGPQAPSLGRQAAQPWVPGNREGSGRRRRRPRPRLRPLGGGPLRKPAGATPVTSSCKLRFGLRGCLQNL